MLFLTPLQWQCLHPHSIGKETEASEECRAGLNPDLTNSKDHVHFLTREVFSGSDAEMTLRLGSPQHRKGEGMQTWAGQIPGR